MRTAPSLIRRPTGSVGVWREPPPPHIGEPYCQEAVVDVNSASRAPAEAIDGLLDSGFDRCLVTPRVDHLKGEHDVAGQRSMLTVQLARANRSDAGECRMSTSPIAHATVATIIVPRITAIPIER